MENELNEAVNLVQKFPFFSSNVDQFELAHSNSTYREVGMVLLCPEVFEMRLAVEIIQFLKTNGFEIINFNFVPYYNKELIGHHIPVSISDNFRWWLIQERFSLGPVMAILIRSTAGLAAFSSLKTLKGFRIPSKASPESLRASLPSVNGLLNLIHTPDDFSFFLRDAEPFFSPEEINASLHHKDKKEIENISKRLLNYFHFLSKPQRKNITFVKTLSSVIFRLFYRIYIEKPEKEVAAFINSLANFRQELNSEKTIIGSGAILSEWLISRKNQLLDIFEIFDNSENRKIVLSLSIIKQLIDFKNYNFYNWAEIRDSLLPVGIHLNEWDELIMQSTYLELNHEFPMLMNDTNILTKEN